MNNCDKIPVYPTPLNTNIQQTSTNELLPTYIEATSFQQPNNNTFQTMNPNYQSNYVQNPRVITVTSPSTCYVERHCPDECHEEWISHRRRGAIIALSIFIITSIIFCIIFFSIRNTNIN